MELDKALEFAVVLGWDDLKKVSRPMFGASGIPKCGWNGGGLPEHLVG